MKQTSGFDSASPSVKGRSSLLRASSSVPFVTLNNACRPSSAVVSAIPSGKLSAFGSGTLELSGSISPRKPTSSSSRLWTPGRRSSKAAGFSHLSSQVEDAPTNQKVARLTPLETASHPSSASCSTDQRSVLLKAIPQSLPSHGGALPSAKAAESTSSLVHRTAHLSLASASLIRSFSSSSLSSPDILSKSFLKFWFCFLHCLLHSLSTSCCICFAAAWPGSTSRRSLRVAKQASSLLIDLCALAMRYKALVMRCAGRASRLPRAFSTDLMAASKSFFFM
mmetsp:Transcript_89378/g.158606  ORF Transcript_89378/g.158606 Transcript_89378/m.158606 type:complete len:280 (+) Transcript_89378:400-1239(+)